MLWFRRKKKQQDVEQAPVEVVAPPEPEIIAQPLASSGGSEEEEESRPKRRRGNRGGRNRRKSGSTPEAGSAAATPASPEKDGEPERKPDREPPRRERERQGRRRRGEPKRAPLPSAKRELLVSVDIGEKRVAVVEDDKVAEVYLERPERRSIAGNIYLGTVDNVLPGMEAAFVEVGLEKNGFLYVDEIVVPELEGKRHGKKIQDLISRGQEVLVQAVKDPMKTKGARLTTEISLPGRFVVFVPMGEGLGVSRRLEDDERQRLKDILKNIETPKGGVIVRTAAEGASAEDIERDLVFLQRLWKTIQARAKQVQAPALVYQEAELPLRVVRDLFAGDFERALIDDERTYKRIVGYLKKTSPHMVERVARYREKAPLFEASGVDAEIRSTLSRRVDLPSGGYLVFDYAEAFTVIDVNTGRFVGSRSKGSGARLEDTITKNNLEAVKEVVRQLRLRDIGGIIVIDFIDMANPKNRAAVEEALRTELERDRTKTYVVEISPLGLVEMTRQNVTDGPREILTKKCPTCAGDGIVVSEASAAVEVERRLRQLAAGSRVQAFQVELNAHVGSTLVGPGAQRLQEIEAAAKRRFFLELREDVSPEHFALLRSGKRELIAPQAPVSEGDELELKLLQLALHDADSAVGQVEGYEICVGGAARLVGKKLSVRIERVLDGTAYAVPVGGQGPTIAPITAEGEAEKPTRAPRGRKASGEESEPLELLEAAETADEEELLDLAESEVAGELGEEEVAAEDEERPKKRTRRGSRGGRGRRRKQAVEGSTDAVAGAESGEPEEIPVADELVDLSHNGDEPAAAAETAVAPRIHVPDTSLGRDGDEPEERETDGSEQGPTDEAAAPKRRTRRGTRGGRNRRRKAPLAPDGTGSAVADEGAPEGDGGDGELIGGSSEPAATDGESASEGAEPLAAETPVSR